MRSGSVAKPFEQPGIVRGHQAEIELGKLGRSRFTPIVALGDVAALHRHLESVKQPFAHQELHPELLAVVWNQRVIEVEQRQDVGRQGNLQ